MNVIEEIQKEQMDREFPEFTPGDTVRVNVKIKEGGKSRIQAFEGVVIRMRSRGVGSTFTVRKISFGEGVERTFALYSPIIGSIKVVRSGKVKRAKLYYLRDRKGKSARIAEKIKKRIGVDVSRQISEREKEIDTTENQPIVEKKKEVKKLFFLFF